MSDEKPPLYVGVVGESSFGPRNRTLAIKPPPMRWHERLACRIGGALVFIAYPFVDLGEKMIDRARDRVKAIARAEMRAQFGEPGPSIYAVISNDIATANVTLYEETDKGNEA